MGSGLATILTARRSHEYRLFSQNLIPAVPSGATNGVTKNFQVLMEVLGTFKDLGEGAAQPKLRVDPQVRLVDLPCAIADQIFAIILHTVACALR